MTLSELPEILSIRQAAQLVRISTYTFSCWLHSGMTPMGEIKEGVHYYREGVAYKIIKNRLALLFGMINADRLDQSITGNQISIP